MKELLVNAFFCASPSQSWTGLWSHPRSNSADYNSLAFWTDLARTCERGLLDGIFLADTLGVADVYESSPAAVLRAASFVPALDPMLVIPPMAAVTKNLTFGVTGNTSYEVPYLLARRLSTLDHLTEGRIAWNVVTGILEATSRAVGLPNMRSHDERYRIADEYMDVMYKLWESSWDDNAAVRDYERKVFAEPERVRAITHQGKYFQCHGIHLSEPSPQRTPLIFSAGASSAGIDFVGKHAECAFISGGDQQFIKRVVASMRNAAVAHGRLPTDIKIFLAATIIVQPTEKQAWDLHNEYQGYCDYAGNLAFNSGLMGIDLSQYSADEPLPKVKTNASQTKVTALTVASRKPWTIKDLGVFAPMEGRDTFLVGSTTKVCDQIEHWMRETDIDGLNLVRSVEPEAINNFCDMVVPELQSRGLFKTAYREGSLRQKLFPETDGRVPIRHPANLMRYENAASSSILV